MSYILDAIDPVLEPAACHVGSCLFKAKMSVTRDLSEIMPYVNAKAKVVFYDTSEPVIVFKYAGCKVAMRAHELAAATVSHVAEARTALQAIVNFLNELWEQRETITPVAQERRRPPAIFIYKLLPKSNCGECGEPTCLAFATRLSLADKELAECPKLSAEQAEELKKMLNEA
ncbi:MAG: (Fe-S)-binding protein [Dissulfuribacterales bacterium]